MAIVVLGLGVFGAYLFLQETGVIEPDRASREREMKQQQAAERARAEHTRASKARRSSKSAPVDTDSLQVEHSEEMILTAISMLADPDEETREGARLYLESAGAKALPYLEAAIKESRSREPELYKEANRLYRRIVRSQDDT